MKTETVTNRDRDVTCTKTFGYYGSISERTHPITLFTVLMITDRSQAEMGFLSSLASSPSLPIQSVSYVCMCVTSSLRRSSSLWSGTLRVNSLTTCTRLMLCAMGADILVQLPTQNDSEI